MNEVPNVPGVYAITCNETGLVYVGSAVWIAKRWRHHREELRAGEHHNSRLQRAWNKYGEEAFTFAVLESCAKNELIAREQWHMDRLQAADRRFGFNHLSRAGSRLGSRMSDEARKKLSTIAKQRPPMSPELRLRAAEQMKGNRHASGLKHSEETRAKLRAAASRPRGPRKTPVSTAVRQKIGERFRGVALAVEHKEKIAAALKGKPKSEEHRRRLSQVQRRYDDEQVAVMRTMRADGSNYSQIGRAFGCTKNTAKAACVGTGGYA